MKRKRFTEEQIITVLKEAEHPRWSIWLVLHGAPPGWLD
jgi:hypothetical protein